MMRGLLAGLLLAAPSAATANFPAKVIEQGRYLAVAGDCTACHTAPGGPPFAGGRVIASPVGPIVATNITPSRRFGIGRYSEDQFATALREGRRADGRHLYPAMPYTSYALLSDADVHALYAYFMAGVRPVDRAVPATRLPFPFNIRSSMAVWNAAFLDRKRFAFDQSQDARWNRGAYLVRALGHCSACHSPRGLLMQESTSRALSGAVVGAWYAPNITSDPVAGIGGWRGDEIVSYLGTGVARGKARAAGGMAEVVEHSLSHLTMADLQAMAAYLKTVPPVVSPQNGRAADAVGGPALIEPSLRGANIAQGSGAALFSGLCASCHGSTGSGTPDAAFPSLFQEASVGAGRANNLIAVILNGVDRKVGGRHVNMPGFGAGSYVQSLTDDQVAALATFVRRRFGPGGIVTAADVAIACAGGPRSSLPTIVNGILMGLLVLGLGAFSFWARRRTRA